MINIFAFSNKIKQYTIAVEDLPEFTIKIKDDTSERKLSDIFNLIAKIILKDLETEYKLLFIFSGKISDEDSTQLKAYDLANSLKNTAKIESNVIQYNINNQKNDKSNDINKETNYVLRNISSIDINIESPIYEINTNDSNEDKINKIVSIFSNEKNTKTKSNNSSNLSNSIPNFVNSSNSSNKDNFKSIVMDSDMDENILENPNNEEKKFRFIDNIRDKLYKAFNNCKPYPHVTSEQHHRFAAKRGQRHATSFRTTTLYNRCTRRRVKLAAVLRLSRRNKRRKEEEQYE